LLLALAAIAGGYVCSEYTPGRSAKMRAGPEFKPWVLRTGAGLAFLAPRLFAARAEGLLTVYRPPGEAERLPFIAIAAVPPEAADLPLNELLMNLRPRPHDPVLAVRQVQTTANKAISVGFETNEDGVRGWTYVLSRGGRPAAVLAIGTPTYWSLEKAAGFRDCVVRSAAMP
jgi:hypothetical protein